MNEEIDYQAGQNGSDAIAALERAQIDIQIATAKRYPRVLSQVKSQMLSFATLDEETAASCFYTVPRGGKAIQGPSARLAEIAASCYGNIKAGSRIISVVSTGENPHVIIQSVCHDLQTNVAVSIEKRRRIVSKKDFKTGGRKPVDEDDINLATNAASSIAFRDALFKVIPRALVNPVFEAAKKVAVGQVKSLIAQRGKVVGRLKQMGVPEDRILSVVECRRFEDIGMEQLEILVGLGTAIKEGEVTLEEAFPPAKQDQLFEQNEQPKCDDSEFRPVDLSANTPPPIPPQPPKEPEIPPTDQLASVVVDAGHNFDVWKTWAVETGQLSGQQAAIVESFADVPDAVAKRCLRASAGMLQAIAAGKEMLKV